MVIFTSEVFSAELWFCPCPHVFHKEESGSWMHHVFYIYGLLLWVYFPMFRFHSLWKLMFGNSTGYVVPHMSSEASGLAVFQPLPLPFWCFWGCLDDLPLCVSAVPQMGHMLESLWMSWSINPITPSVLSCNTPFLNILNMLMYLNILEGVIIKVILGIFLYTFGGCIYLYTHIDVL